MKILLLIALVGAASAVPRSQQRIVGGQPATIEEYPFTVALLFSWLGTTFSHACGGTLVTNYHIVTASHCCYGDHHTQWNARLGSSFANSGGNVLAMSQMTLHPDYDDSRLVNDIAIFRMASPTTFGPTVAPARIAGTSYILPDGTTASTTGWGRLWPGGPFPEQLQQVYVDVINHGLCAERYAYLKTQPGYQNWPDVTDDMICTGILDVGGKDACQGDSGGPLIHQDDVFVGITSWGFSCADPHYPGVSARVSEFTDWIVNNTNTVM